VKRRIAAVVVAYHGPDELDRCLVALGAGVAVTVVDNSSSAAVREVASCRGATYVDPERNVGFGAGVNLALGRILEGPPSDVLLLNPDAIVGPDDLRLLGACLHRSRSPRVAAVSPRLVGTDGTAQRVEWPFPSPWRAWAEALGLGPSLRANEQFVIGAVLLLRWEALLEVGPFDERFFLYAEEADWQRRALALGWSSAACPEVTVKHRGAGSSTDPRRRELLFHAGQELYVRKWHGRFGWLVYRSAAFVGAVVRAVLLAGERRAEAARRARLYLRGPRRCAQLQD
jgi:GT2 family glycosyltransferase